MAIWFGRPAPADEDHRWLATLLSEREYALGLSDGGLQAATDEVAPLVLPGTTAGRQRRWVLIAPAELAVRVNSEDLAPLQIHVLQHRDEIEIGDRRFFFSTEALPRATILPADAAPQTCALCLQPILPGTPMVVCRCAAQLHNPDCGSCWRHVDACPRCGCSTAPEAGLSWCPWES
jgi:hypothetical protein